MKHDISMQRRHFEFIADILNNTQRYGFTTDEGDFITSFDLNDLIVRFVSALKGTNTSFDPERFVEACNNRTNYARRNL